MTNPAWVLLGVAGLWALTDWVVVVVGRQRLEWVAKPATLAALVAMALVLQPAHGAVRAWFVVGLVLSLVGDVFLMLPHERFVAGLAAFLAGHIAYVVGFALEQRSGLWLVVGVAVVAVAVGLVGRPVVIAVRRGEEPALVGPVLIYLIAISTMVVTAWGTGLAWAMAGASLFYVSDATLAWNRFVRRLRWGPVAVIVTYHLGQTGLVLGLVSHR